MDKKLGIGSLSCKVCGQKYQTSINYLSAQVDVYSDWVDACEGVNAPGANSDDDGFAGNSGAHDDEDDGIINDDEEEGVYGD